MKTFPPSEVIEILRSLKRGDRIEVHWLDASGFKNMSEKELLSPENYTTPRETIGRFFAFIDNHLVITAERSIGGPDGRPPYEGSSIPIGTVQSIVVLMAASPQQKKQPKKLFKHHLAPMKVITEIVKVPVISNEFGQMA